MKILPYAQLPDELKPSFVETLEQARTALELPGTKERLNDLTSNHGIPLISLAQRGPKKGIGGVITPQNESEFGKIIDYYIAAGANPNIRDTGLGNTPLMWSIANAEVQGAICLIKQAAVKIGIPDNELKSPLHFSILKGYAHHDTDLVAGKGMHEVIDALIERAVCDQMPGLINAKDRLGNTPLHYAVMHREPDLIRKLIASGANPKIPNKLGHIPLDMLDIDYTESVRLIRNLAGVVTVKSQADWHQTLVLDILLQHIATTNETETDKTAVRNYSGSKHPGLARFVKNVKNVLGSTD